MSEEDVSLIPLKITITKGQNFDASPMGINQVLRKTCQFESINEVVRSF